MSNTDVKSTFSEVLDPELIEDLVGMSATYHDNQKAVDDNKWDIAARVNDKWSEHATIFRRSKEGYYAECSRVMNIGKKRKLFADSGETLKVWCNVRESYEAFETDVKRADELLDLLSFDHLRRARSLARRDKVTDPFTALKWALENEASAEEMQYHFDPMLPIHPYDDAKGRVTKWLDKSYWSWLKSAQTAKRIIELVKEIERLIDEDK